MCGEIPTSNLEMGKSFWCTSAWLKFGFFCSCWYLLGLGFWGSFLEVCSCQLCGFQAPPAKFGNGKCPLTRRKTLVFLSSWFLLATDGAKIWDLLFPKTLSCHSWTQISDPSVFPSSFKATTDLPGESRGVWRGSAVPLSSAANLIMSGFSEIYESSIGLRKFFLVFFFPRKQQQWKKKE